MPYIWSAWLVPLWVRRSTCAVFGPKWTFWYMPMTLLQLQLHRESIHIVIVVSVDSMHWVLYMHASFDLLRAVCWGDFKSKRKFQDQIHISSWGAQGRTFSAISIASIERAYLGLFMLFLLYSFLFCWLRSSESKAENLWSDSELNSWSASISQRRNIRQRLSSARV